MTSLPLDDTDDESLPLEDTDDEPIAGRYR